VADLTEREIEVLRLVARGYSNLEIAAQLTISPKTVSRHLESIYSKLNVTTRAAATYFAMHHHVV
jgi:DNA-binding NarL/FixJ family response regulator